MHASLTIDGTGHITLPQALLEELHLSPGDTLELDASGDAITLRPVRGTAEIIYKHGIPVVHTGHSDTSDNVNDIIEQMRLERDLSNLYPTG